MTPATSTRAPADGAQVVAADLQYICERLDDEFSAMSGKRLLITGGAGFLGYYLVQSVAEWNRDRAVPERIQLTVLDNFSRGEPEWLVELAKEADMTVVERDMILPLPAEMGHFEYVVHAASVASPIYYRLHPIETMDANVNGLRHLLERWKSAQEAGSELGGFLFYSTSEVYGDPTPGNIPTPETYFGNVSTMGPRACYDESKRYGETLCANFHRVYDMPIKMARPFNNYGPGLKITDRRVLPDYARDILDGRDIVMLSDGSPSRTFCYVADAIVGYYRILVRGRPGEAYNIGADGPEISMRELADRTVALGRDLFDYEGRVILKVSDDPEYLTNNPQRRCPIIDKARRDLGYEPGIDLDEGLRRSLLWYHDNQHGTEA
ncbi:MAG: NAD-dependent epimerase/dehydratase family protein [Gemmatimonadota bacterium]